ncbi:MAG TPA: LamG-like jellyroll fold domain-containing protein [Methylomirabilota bacterium]|nr:LamG-like jellyroll fold domain-containing protein [Methylomirabilota bacterium]
MPITGYSGGIMQFINNPPWGGPTDHLIHRWQLDDASVSGSTVIDLAGSLNGTITGGVTSVSSPAGAYASTARHFDGTGYINLGAAALPDFTGAHSVFFWLNLTNNANVGGTASQSPLDLHFDSNNKVRIANDEAISGGGTGGYVVSFVQAGTNIGREVNISNTIPSNSWVHLGYTWDGANISLYVGGVVQAPPPQTAFGVNTLDVIGSALVGVNSAIVGSMYQVCVWSKVLSGTEITQVFSAK